MQMIPVSMGQLPGRRLSRSRNGSLKCGNTRVATLCRCDTGRGTIRMLSTNNDHDNKPGIAMLDAKPIPGIGKVAPT